MRSSALFFAGLIAVLQLAGALHAGSKCTAKSSTAREGEPCPTVAFECGGKQVASFYLGNLAAKPNQLHPNEMVVAGTALDKSGDGETLRNYTYFFNVCQGTNGSPPAPEGHNGYNIPCDNPSPDVAAWQQGTWWDDAKHDKYMPGTRN